MFKYFYYGNVIYDRRTLNPQKVDHRQCDVKKIAKYL